MEHRIIPMRSRNQHVVFASAGRMARVDLTLTLFDRQPGLRLHSLELLLAECCGPLPALLLRQANHQVHVGGLVQFRIKNALHRRTTAIA